MANVRRDFPSGVDTKTIGDGQDGSLEKPVSERSQEKRSEVEELENAQTPVNKTFRKRTRVRNHCAKFWLWWLIGVIVFLAIFLPCLFLKIIPAIIQNEINHRSLPFLHAQMGAKSETELEFSFSTILKAPGSMSARMDSFNLSMYNTFTEGFYPYTVVTLPSHELKGSTTISINSTSPVLNDTEISKWLNTTFYGAHSQISFRGSTTLHFGALSAPIEIKKSVTIAGLNHLQGFTLGTPKLILPAEPDGTNLEGNLTLANPGAVAIKFGDLAFNASVAGIFIGNLSISNVLLAQGNNTVPFRGQILLDAVVENLNTILGNSSSGSNGTVEMAISGGTCMVDGKHITYIENVLDATVLYASIPLQKLIEDGLSSVMGTNSTSGSEALVNSSLEVVEDDERVYGRGASNHHTLTRRSTELPEDAVEMQSSKGHEWKWDGKSDVAKAARLYQRLIAMR